MNPPCNTTSGALQFQSGRRALDANLATPEAPQRQLSERGNGTATISLAPRPSGRAHGQNRCFGLHRLLARIRRFGVDRPQQGGSSRRSPVPLGMNTMTVFRIPGSPPPLREKGNPSTRSGNRESLTRLSHRIHDDHARDLSQAPASAHCPGDRPAFVRAEHFCQHGRTCGSSTPDETGDRKSVV